MAKKTDPFAPPAGGWIGPSGNSGPPIHYADKTKLVRGKREWDWKVATAQFVAEQEAARARALAGSPPVEEPVVHNIRVRTRPVK